MFIFSDGNNVVLSTELQYDSKEAEVVMDCRDTLVLVNEVFPIDSQLFEAW